jgi:peptide chain release factor subunit 1
MATDPVQNISIEEYDSGFSTNLGAALRELGRLAPSLGAPYLSVYLDWRPDGQRPQRRSARTLFENRADELLDGYPEDREERAGLERDIERVREFLNNDLDPAVHGVIIIANDAMHVFEPFVLALPVETSVSLGPTPSLRKLTQAVEDYPRYAVLLADQQDAILTIINRASRIASVEIQGDDMVHHHKQGGWSQRRFQARHEARRASFARAIAEETRRALSDGGIDMLVLAGGEVMTSALNAEFHDEVKKRIVGTLNLDIRTSQSELIDATTPIVERAERKREFEIVQAVLDEAGAGNRGVLGIDDTLEALQRGQVMTLVMSSQFDMPGWADYTLDLYGAGPPPAAHPAGGNLADLRKTNLTEELIRLTIVTDAEGEIIHENGAAATKLGNHQVGALLRFVTG